MGVVYLCVGYLLRIVVRMKVSTSENQRSDSMFPKALQNMNGVATFIDLRDDVDGVVLFGECEVARTVA